MKKTVKTKVFATVLAAVCAVSAVSTAAIIGVSAASSSTSVSQSNKEAVIVSKTSGSTFVLPIKGIDWNYYADSLDAKVTCDIDFNTGVCNFKLTAVKPGAANIDLKTKDSSGVWTVTPIRVTVGSDLKMSIVQTGEVSILK